MDNDTKQFHNLKNFSSINDFVEPQKMDLDYPTSPLFQSNEDNYNIQKLFPFFCSDDEDEKNEKNDNKIFNEMFPFSLYDESDEDKFCNNPHDNNINNFISSIKINDSDNEISMNNKENNINILSQSYNKKGEEIIEKISSYISNYQDIIRNQSAVKSPNHFNLDSNIKLAENTLPGSIISLMKKAGHPLSEEYIYNNIKDKFQSFRKANGAKYSGDLFVVLKSTLKTSGIFLKIEDNSYFYKEQESMCFIIKTIERELARKINESKSNSSKKNGKKHKKNLKKNELSINHQLGYKICKLNGILDSMMEKCRSRGSNDNYKVLNKKFKDEGIEMLKNISEKDKFVGMILCIKFFKGIIEKYIKFCNKKKNIEKYFDVNKFNDKILKICGKIEKIEESFSKENSPNLKIVDLE